MAADAYPVVGEAEVRHRRNPRHMTAYAARRLHFALAHCPRTVAAQASPVVEHVVAAMRVLVRIMAGDAVERPIALLETGAHLQSHRLKSCRNRIVEIHSRRRIGPMAFAAKHHQFIAG